MKLKIRFKDWNHNKHADNKWRDKSKVKWNTLTKMEYFRTKKEYFKPAEITNVFILNQETQKWKQ